MKDLENYGFNDLNKIINSSLDKVEPVTPPRSIPHELPPHNNEVVGQKKKGSYVDENGKSFKDYLEENIKKVNSSFERDINEEDFDLFDEQIAEHISPSLISKVSYISDEYDRGLERVGFDGGYEVTLNDGTVRYFAWNYGGKDLTEITDLFNRKIKPYVDKGINSSRQIKSSHGTFYVIFDYDSNRFICKDRRTGQVFDYIDGNASDKEQKDWIDTMRYIYQADFKVPQEILEQLYPEEFDEDDWDDVIESSHQIKSSRIEKNEYGEDVEISEEADTVANRIQTTEDLLDFLDNYDMELPDNVYVQGDRVITDGDGWTNDCSIPMYVQNVMDNYYFKDKWGSREVQSSRKITSARYIATDPESGEVLGSADTYEEAINEWGEDVTITDSEVVKGEEDMGLFSSIDELNNKHITEGMRVTWGEKGKGKVIMWDGNDVLVQGITGTGDDYFIVGYDFKLTGNAKEPHLTWMYGDYDAGNDKEQAIQYFENRRKDISNSRKPVKSSKNVIKSSAGNETIESIVDWYSSWSGNDMTPSCDNCAEELMEAGFTKDEVEQYFNEGGIYNEDTGEGVWDRDFVDRILWNFEEEDIEISSSYKIKPKIAEDDVIRFPEELAKESAEHLRKAGYDADVVDKYYVQVRGDVDETELSRWGTIVESSKNVIKSGPYNPKVLRAEKEIQAVSDYLYDIGESDIVHQITDDLDTATSESDYVRRVHSWIHPHGQIEEILGEDWDKDFDWDTIESSKTPKGDKAFLSNIVSSVSTNNMTEEQAVKRIALRNNCNEGFARNILSEALKDPKLIQSGVMEIADDINKEFDIDGNIDSWLKAYMKDYGASTTVGGEILRAFAKIRYRYYNDGDRIGIGYGRETVNPAARYLLDKIMDSSTQDIEEMLNGESDINHSDDTYEEWLEGFEGSLENYLRNNEELFHTPNKEDMWDYTTDEDKDNTVTECYIYDRDGNAYYFENDGNGDWKCYEIEYANSGEFEVGDIVDDSQLEQYVDFSDEDDYIDFEIDSINYSAERAGDTHWEITNIELENGLVNEGDYWSVDDLMIYGPYDMNGYELSENDLY